MFITKLSRKGAKTTVRYLNEFDELEVSTEAPPRPELKTALINLYAIVCKVYEIKSPMKKDYDIEPPPETPLKFIPIEITRTNKKDDGEYIKITCQTRRVTLRLGNPCYSLYWRKRIER